MLKPYQQIILIGTIILCAKINYSASQTPGMENFERKFLSEAKRQLLLKENKYLQAKPMSRELQSFIQKHRRDRRERRLKRSHQIDENSLYVVEDGQLIPFNRMRDFKRDEENNGFTVIPLVVPVASNIFKRDSDEVVTDESSRIKIRDTSEKTTDLSVSKSSAEQSSTSVNGEGQDEEGKSNDDENKVLHKILDDVEGLMRWKNDGNKKEGAICNLNGSWISEAAGMRFDICFNNSTRKKFKIHVAERIPPNEDGFMCDGNWSVFGELPFQHSGVVIVLAVHHKDKHLAAFIGECRTCEGSQTVSGTWLVGRISRDCKDQKASHKIFSDVWRKEETHALQKKHLMELGYTDVENLINT